MKTQLGFCETIESEEQWKRVAHHSTAWADWDGGQVGGRPSWLNPLELPARPTTCAVCSQGDGKATSNNKNNAVIVEMRFVCQLYAPLEGSAFHRSLYVFACPNMAQPQHRENPATGIRVLRTQLSQDNPYWPPEGEEDAVAAAEWTQHQAERYLKNGLCAVCGFRATGRCPLQQKSFCGPAHQRLYKRYYNKNNTTTQNEESEGISSWKKSKTKSSLPIVYNMLEIVVEEEPPLPAIVELHDDATAADKNQQDRPSTLYPTNDDGGSDSDEDLDQEALNKIVSGKDGAKRKNDSTYQNFVERLSGRPDCKDQVLRYCRWPEHTDGNSTEHNGPLWVRSDHQPDSIPSCPYCGAERKFEFQLMPQLLNYLTNDAAIDGDNPKDYESVKAALEQADSLVQQAPPEQVPPAFVDAKNAAVSRMREQLLKGSGSSNRQAALDWGVVAVYTCTESCCGKKEQQVDDGASLGAYREEYAWTQPSIDDYE